VPILLDVFLVANRYDAADGQDPGGTEWPPSPARVFCALRSVASDDDLPTLADLERLPAPTIHASGAMSGGSRSFVVTNATKADGGNLSHPGRTNVLRQRRSVFPYQPRMRFIWPDDGGLSEGALARLDALARQVPYLGRSTSFVLMGVRRVADARVPDGLQAYVPTDDSLGDVRLRVPFPGYLKELDALYAADLPAWTASETARAKCWYRLVDDTSEQEPSSPIWRSPYRTLVVLRFADARPAGNLVRLFTTALRTKVMGQTVDPLPPALHGHDYDGFPHVAYLGLPVCGGPHADGRLVALAVAIPGMEETERRRILRGILGPSVEGQIELRVPGFRQPFRLTYQPQERLPKTATVGHWSRPSRQWVTATPIVLDRYPKRGDLASAVAKSVTLAGFPEPVIVETSTAGLTSGAVHLRSDELPAHAQGRPFYHARVTFDRKVSGPMLVGAGRYFGAGLLLPEAIKSAGEGEDDDA